MPDTEVGHILTNLYGAAMSAGVTRSPPPPSYHTPSSTAPPPSQPRAPSSTSGMTPSDALRTPSTAASPYPPPGGHSPAAAIKRSRSRPTKSCEECRRKKLKCDRELPCSNCKKGGRDGSLCVFKDGPSGDGEKEKGMKRLRVGEAPRFVSPPRQYLSPQSQYREEERSERIMGNGEFQMRENPARQAQPYSLPGMVNLPSFHSIANDRESQMPPFGNMEKSLVPTSTLGYIHVKRGKSRYVGLGDRMAMLDHFEDPKNFIVNSFKDPDMSSVVMELSAYQHAFNPRHRPQCQFPDDREALKIQMIKALPTGPFLGILQNKYILNWETIYRVLHIGSFITRCHEIIAIRDSGSYVLPNRFDDSIIPQILAVVAIASRLYDPSDRSAPEPISNEQILINCQMVQRWLDTLHGKACLSFEVIRTRTLLLLAQHANIEHPGELYRSSGNLIRYAMITGLHQDPEDTEKLSKFAKEQRRKLWVTIVELDIQFSLATGLPPAVQPNFVNLNELVNVDDHDLREDMTEYPPSKPYSIWTHSLPQIALRASLPDRLRIANLLGGQVNLERDAPVMLAHAKILETELLSLPAQFRSSTKAGNTNNKILHRLFSSVMLDMSLRRPLLALYRTIYLSPLASRYPEARRGALRSSLAILSHLDALDPAVADLNIVKTRDYLNLFHIMCKSDIIQAAIIVCCEIRSFNSSRSDDEVSNSEFQPLPEDSFPQTKHTLTRLVENTLNGYIQRIGEFGSDLKDTMPLSILLQCVRSDGTPDEKRELMIKGAERILNACRKAMPNIPEEALQHVMARANKMNTPPSSGQSWNSTAINNLDPVRNAVGLLVNDYSIPDIGFDFQNIDFDFTDWDIGQSWL